MAKLYVNREYIMYYFESKPKLSYDMQNMNGRVDEKKIPKSIEIKTSGQLRCRQLYEHGLETRLYSLLLSNGLSLSLSISSLSERPLEEGQEIRQNRTSHLFVRNTVPLEAEDILRVRVGTVVQVELREFEVKLCEGGTSGFTQSRNDCLLRTDGSAAVSMTEVRVVWSWR
jgi:hypothetical protein